MIALALLPALNPLMTPLTLAERFQRTPDLIMSVLELALAVAFLTLRRAAPDYRVFGTLSAYYLLLASEQLLSYAGAVTLEWALRAVAVALLVESVAQSMRIRRYGWTRLFWPLYFLAFLGSWFSSLVSFRDFGLFSEIPAAILTWIGFRYGSGRDRILAAALTVFLMVRITLFPGVQAMTGVHNFVQLGAWQWKLTGLSLVLLGGVTLIVFVNDLGRDRREKQRLATELEAARAIQQVLIPEQMPVVPGYQMSSIYRPFGEVGGDFFQILPQAEGGVLVAIGDVSGKGLQAAMQVSLLVGSLRALAGYLTSPAAMLTKLNRLMMGRSNGGFTTCLILRLEADGRLTAANAGHIAPYRDEEELALDSSLPLGLADGIMYTESTFALAAGEQITLMTDGIVEARSVSGELFGFERTAAITSHSAEVIADLAQSFGQDDDITVLKLVFEA